MNELRGREWIAEWRQKFLADHPGYQPGDGTVGTEIDAAIGQLLAVVDAARAVLTRLGWGTCTCALSQEIAELAKAITALDAKGGVR